ncbi:MAG: hypothetical protein PCFJNLEI_03978 [Verrucomicrobiae bacterium]|nr:hypothetical protein [Verrucomicrobiae bacterium]
MIWLAGLTLLGLLAVAIEFARGNRMLRRLHDLPPGQFAGKVSIIVAARNEAGKIEPALRSLLKQDYPNLEFIVVNDRSTDSTGAILDRIEGIKVVHIGDLPAGWLGKNHAQHAGAGQATGEFLLFTDADIHMESSTISRAVNHLVSAQLDHLAIAPQLAMPGTLLSMFGGAFTIFFGMYAKPWKARDPKSSRHIGIGAFNLVRAAVYRKIGGHEPLRMRPDDDMKLGKLIKKSGYRQDMVLAGDMVTVEWYSSLGELVKGLEKNSFAGVEYNLSVVVAASIAQTVLFVWPVVALFVTTGLVWLFNLAIIAVIALMYMDNAPFHGLKRWHWIGFPLTAILFQYIIWNATLKTLLHDGIDWRGTHYSLAELKANKV